MMTAKLKCLVSKKKRRYKDDDFDLDLSYIYHNIIAMGFPADKMEGVYRNHIDDVVRFFDSKHDQHYKIYNLCTERHYDVNRFQNVAQYPFEDHNPPTFELIKQFCDDMDEWLSKDKSNLAAVHCKAGKGRTGLMICAYLLHKKLHSTAEEALNYYGNARTHNKKGVTIPSQRRYVEYYAEFLRKRRDYEPIPLGVKSIQMEPIPTFNGTLYFVIFQQKTKVYSSPILEVKSKQKILFFEIPEPVLICGDVKVEFRNRPKLGKTEILFSFWFNTFFIRNETSSPSDANQTNGCTTSSVSSYININTYTRRHDDGLPAYHFLHSPHLERNRGVHHDEHRKCLVLNLCKSDLDKAHKDKTHKFSKDFKVRLEFASITDSPSSVSFGSDTHSVLQHYSDAGSSHGGETSSDNEMLDSETDSDDDDDWEATHV